MNAAPTQGFDADERRRLQTMLSNVAAAVDKFYWQFAFPIGCHPFIEFCGLMSTWLKMAELTLQAGEDFSEANAHSGRPLIAQLHQVSYLGEKFACIFGPVLADPEYRQEFLRQLDVRPARSKPFMTDIRMGYVSEDSTVLSAMSLRQLATHALMGETVMPLTTLALIERALQDAPDASGMEWSTELINCLDKRRGMGVATRTKG